jgi:hypothetical protein
MSIKLFHTLVYMCLAATGSDWAASAKQGLCSATELEWKQSLVQLELHRLLPLVSYSLQTHGLTDTVPQPYLTKMQYAYRQTLQMNTFFLLTLNGLLRAMRERDVHPVLWKGVVLADSFYPDPGTRLMGDIDFAIAPDEMDEATAAFKSLGFLEQKHQATEDAIYFANQIGVVCDVHHRVRLFEGKESMNLTVDQKPQRMQAPVFTVLEPNAMLVHLIVHMDGHRSETGRVLLWILDLAFVMRKWGALLDLEQIERLMPAKENLVSLFRTIRFLEHEFDERLPDCLADAAKRFEPFTLAEVLRERRLALWGLPQTRGWLRLGAYRLGLRPTKNLPYPNVRDLLLWPADAIRNR